MPRKLARAPSQTRKFWLDHLEQWNSSGMSKAAYCRQNNLSAGNFYNWFSKESLSGDTRILNDAATTLKFMPVTIDDTTATATTITLRSNRFVFEFPADLPTDAIDRWLTVIERQRA